MDASHREFVPGQSADDDFWETVEPGWPPEGPPDSGEAPAGSGEEPPGRDGAEPYLQLAERYRRPTSEEELRCCRAMRQAAEEIEAGGRSAAEAIRVLHENRNRMVLGHLRLVIRMARRYARHYGGFGLSLGDFIQEGNLGLMGAVRCFDPERGVRFASYARKWVRGSICRALSSKVRMIKIPIEPLTLRRRAASVGSELEQRYRNETCCDGRCHRHVLEDDAEVIGVDPVALRATIRRVPDIESLDEPEVGGGPSRDTRIEDRRSPNPQDAAEAFEATGHLRDAVAHLPERLRTLMRRRYGLDGAEETSLTEIGRDLGITPQRVHQLHRRALELLRHDRHFR